MQAGRQTKQYGATLPAGSNTPATCLRITAHNPKRTMLMIQNTGANPGLVRFSESVLGDGSDITFAAGSGILWDRASTCPEAAINLGSSLGTTFAIVEQITT